MKFARFARRRRNGRAGAAPQHRTLRAEPLEPRLVLSGGGLLITELMAANGATLADGDGGTSDWIELHNATEQSVELGDYFLTDDADDLQKWPFPAVSLAAGDYLVVFASATEDAVGDVIDDYVDAGGSYHTNFQLDRDGEFLALTFEDPAEHDVSIISQFAPAFPPQRADISFGTSQSRQTLVAADGPVNYLVPTDSALGETWTSPNFADAAWTSGTLGVGYETDAGGGATGQELVNLAPGGVATQSSVYSGFVPQQALDGDYGSFTHTAAGQNLPAWWQADLSDTFALERVVLHNRDSCCQSRLRDIRVEVLDDSGSVVFSSPLINPENTGFAFPRGPETIDLDLVAQHGGTPVIGQTVRVIRSPDPDLSGTGGQGNNDEADVLSLGEVEIFGRDVLSYDQIFATDLQDILYDQSASIFLRVPFSLTEVPSDLDQLLLRVQYDDGFSAYLNGTQIATRNAPASPVFNSAATAERMDVDAVQFETIDISQYVDLLQQGENILAIQGLNLSAGDDDFLLVPELVGISTAGTQRYFVAPTPGAANNEGIAGFVADTQFSVDRGFYAEPLDVEITSATPAAEIYFTLDGAPPTPANGTLYTSPITIAGTTVLRALATKDGYLSSNIDTQTYLFLDDIVRQDDQATRDAGFPSSWGRYTADYGMDPDVIGNFDSDGNPTGGDRFDGLYAATIKDDLQAIPTMSIVMETDELFGPNGIYTNATQNGEAWERATSVELINPDGSPGFQIDAGIRIQGGAFRSDGLSKKHSFRLLFKDQYGPTKLRFPLFGDIEGVADEFNTIVLRAGANDGYTWSSAKLTEQYTRDEFGRSLQRAAGSPSAHGTFVHLYINGIYWGLHNPTERPDNEFSASYSGGDPDNWDAIHVGETTAGDRTAWNAMLAKTQAAATSLTHYMQLQGLNNDGTPNPASAPLLDVQNYVDYMAINYWGGNWDWPWKNWWAGRDRDAATTTGFKFYNWDFENTMGNNRSRSPLNMNSLNRDHTGSSNAGQAHTNLRSNAEYRMLFADRVHEFFFNGGILTPAALSGRYQEIADGVERSIVAESARWGDMHHSTPLTLAEWVDERDWLLQTYLPQRSAIVLGQLRGAGLYPATDAAMFSQHGGQVPSGSAIEVSAPAGLIYYTLDGSDPRMIGGQPDPSALVFDTNNNINVATLVPTGAAWRYLDNGSNQGTVWTEPGFSDAGWDTGNAQLGYGDGDEQTVVSYGPNSSNKYITTYFRRTFEAADVADVSNLTLRLQRDDGAVVYLNGAEVARSNMPTTPISYTTLASGSASDESAFHEFSIDPAALVEGDNVIAVEIHQRSATSSDISFDLELTSRTGDGGEADVLTIPISATTHLKARTRVGNQWSALNEATFLVATPAAAGNLAITELNYNPYDPLPQFGDLDVDSDEFEFVELTNISDAPVSLLGARFSAGIEFTFGDETLAPGQRTLVVHNQAAFASRYGTGRPIAGDFVAGKLSNGGELIRLAAADGSVIAELTYSDNGSWPGRADGKGATLELIDPAGSYDDPGNWRSSNQFGGSPGTAGTGPVTDVIVNEVLSHSESDSQDLVELYNTTDSSIDLGGWFVSDEDAQVLKSTLAAGTTIDGHDYLVLDQAQLGFGLDGQLGDDLWLIAADPATGRPLRFADHVTFGATEAGVTLGRWPDGDPDLALFPMTHPSFGTANSGPLVGDMVISEIHYHPAPPPEGSAISQEELEFVEVTNRGGTGLVLGGWQLDGFGFQFPDGTVLAPGTTAVVVRFDPVAEPAKADAFREVYAVAQPGVTLLGPASGGLQNGGERLKLLRPLGTSDPVGYVLVDQVRYDDQPPWPVAAGGSGQSLTRVTTDSFGGLVASWTAADPSPGTLAWVIPGDVNGDGQVNGLDVDPFVALLVTGQTDAAADMNGDGLVNGLDVELFVNVLVGAGGR